MEENKRRNRFFGTHEKILDFIEQAKKLGVQSFKISNAGDLEVVLYQPAVQKALMVDKGTTVNIPASVLNMAPAEEKEEGILGMDPKKLYWSSAPRYPGNK